MAYARRHGNQVAIVHGARDPETKKVQQSTLFTLYSKAEALEALGRGSQGSQYMFRSLLQNENPKIKLDWKKIDAGIEDNLDVLPDLYPYKQKVESTFRGTLCGFAKQLLVTDPQSLVSSARLLQSHRHDLEYIRDLIDWRLDQSNQDEDQWNKDNPFYWRSTLRGRQVPCEAEEQLAGLYTRGEHDKAAALAQLLLDCFDDYADGHNYLGLVALDADDLDAAIHHFETTVEVGRRLFPKRIPKSHWWADTDTRPYMRGLRNLTITLNRAGRYDKALDLCDRQESECYDDISPAVFRARIFLNTGFWAAARAAAEYTRNLYPEEGFIIAFAALEAGDDAEAVTNFLHAALNHPRAARMLTRLRSGKPSGHNQVRDHNTGVSMKRALHGYLGSQSRRSKQFFSAQMKQPTVVATLTEVEEVVERRHRQRPTGEREAFDRMNEMQSWAFAERLATGVGQAVG